MPASTPFRALRVARRTTCHRLLPILLLSALLLGCDSLGAGSSGPSLTADTPSISPSDSTVTLTLTNDSPSPIYADFFCGLSIEKKVDGAWGQSQLINPVCARFLSSPVANKSAATSKLSIRPAPTIAPGESVEYPIVFRNDLREATAVRFRIRILYRKISFTSSTPLPRGSTQGKNKNTVGDIAFYPSVEGLDGRGELVTEEIRVTS